MQKRTHTLILIAILAIFQSCMDDNSLWKNQPIPHIQKKAEGVFIINEGNFMYNNASLSYYDIASKEIHNNIFFNVNSTPLGDVAYRMTIKDSLAYIAINNSGKIYVINTNTFELTNKITGFVSPRYISFISNVKGYVSDLYAKTIYIINPENNQIIGNINVNNNNTEFAQHSTEQIIKYNNLIFVNCWSYDNKILVIDTKTDKLIDSIEVPKQPVSMVLDSDNKLWVLTDGGFEGSPYGNEPAALIKINPENLTIERKIKFEKSAFPKSLVTNSRKDTLFFIKKDVYFLPINSPENPKILLESTSDQIFGGYYALGVSPVSSDIYVADALDLMQNGVIYRYKSDLSLLDTFEVGIIPTQLVFK